MTFYHHFITILLYWCNKEMCLGFSVNFHTITQTGSLYYMSEAEAHNATQGSARLWRWWKWKGGKKAQSNLSQSRHFTIKTHLNCWLVPCDARALWVWPAASARAKWNASGASHHRRTGAAAPPWSPPPPGASSTPAVTVAAASYCLLPTTALVAIPWNTQEERFLFVPTKVSSCWVKKLSAEIELATFSRQKTADGTSHITRELERLEGSEIQPTHMLLFSQARRVTRQIFCALVFVWRV